MSEENGVWVGSAQLPRPRAAQMAGGGAARGERRGPANCARLVFPCRFPAGGLAGKKLSLPCAAGPTFRSAVTHCFKVVYRQMSAAVSGPNAIFSLRFPVRQRKFRPQTEKYLACGVFGDPGRSRRRTPACTAPIGVGDPAAPLADIDNLKAALAGVNAAGVNAAGAFLRAASPGVISLFFRNDHYASQEAYLFAIAEAMRGEYEAIAAAGVIVQIDCPDLAMGRHIQYADLSVEEFRKRARLHIKALNHALGASRRSACSRHTHPSASGKKVRFLLNSTFWSEHNHAPRNPPI